MQDPTAKVDMWALGITLYQLLTLKHPFDRNDYAQTIKSIMDHPPQPLPEDISAETKQIVMMLLDKDP